MNNYRLRKPVRSLMRSTSLQITRFFPFSLPLAVHQTLDFLAWDFTNATELLLGMQRQPQVARRATPGILTSRTDGYAIRHDLLRCRFDNPA